MLAGSHMTIGISIGIALAPQDGMGEDRLLKNADLALYRAKAGGRNRFCFFDAEIERPHWGGSDSNANCWRR